MENVPDNSVQQTDVDKTTSSLTPHELVEQHMQHPEEPITDAEIENLDLEVNPDAAAPGNEIILTPEEKKCADELADAIDSDSTGMSYDADI